MSSMPRFEAASISITSTAVPSVMLRHASHSLHGSGVGPVLAVEGLGEQPGDGGLAGASRTAEEVGLPDPARP